MPAETQRETRVRDNPRHEQTLDHAQEQGSKTSKTPLTRTHKRDKAPGGIHEGIPKQTNQINFVPSYLIPSQKTRNSDLMKKQKKNQHKQKPREAKGQEDV